MHEMKLYLHEGKACRSPVLRIPQATEEGYAECPEGGVFDCSYPTSKTRRGRTQGGGLLLPTLTCNSNSCLRYYEGYDVTHSQIRVRRLTAMDCFYCMGVSKEKARTISNIGLSENRMCKLAGNSIVIDVLEHIFRKLFIDKGNDDAQMNLF